MHQHRARGRVAVAVLALAVLTACGSGGDDAPMDDAMGSTTASDGVEVGTELLAFDPMEAQVKKGQSVTWVAGDNITHVLVQGTYETGPDGLRTKESDDKAFNLRLTKKGQRVSHTYNTAGTFTYYCTIHRGMNGTVTVS